MPGPPLPLMPGVVVRCRPLGLLMESLQGGLTDMSNHPGLTIVLGDVVRTMEPDFFIVECFATGHSCMLHGNCKLTAVMDGALRSFMEYLDSHTLADVLPPAPDSTNVRPLRFHGRNKVAAR